MILYFFYLVRLFIFVFRKKISLKIKGVLRVVFFFFIRNRYFLLNFIIEVFYLFFNLLKNKEVSLLRGY